MYFLYTNLRKVTYETSYYNLNQSLSTTQGGKLCHFKYTSLVRRGSNLGPPSALSLGG